MVIPNIKFKAYDRLEKKYRPIAELIIGNEGNIIAVRFNKDEDITGIHYVDLQIINYK